MKHDFLRRFGALVLALALVSSLLVSPAFASSGADSTSASITIATEGGSYDAATDTLSMKVGTARLSFAWRDETQKWADDSYNIAWSSDAGIAFFTPNASTTNISAPTVGNYVVTVTLTDKDDATKKISDTLNVEVTADTPVNVPVTGVSLDRTTLSLQEGGTETLIATVAPANATNRTVIWSSSNTDVATVAGGVVTAKQAGTATITATTEDGGKTATCAVTVTAQNLTATKLSFSQREVQKNKSHGDSWQQSVIVEPAGSTSTITWTSSDTEVATVVGTAETTSTVNLRRGTKAGETTLTASTTDAGGKQLTASIRLIVSGIRLNSYALTMLEGKTETLTTTPFGEALNQRVEWYSDNTSVISVTGGRLTARSTGSAKITASTADGYTATCQVTVVEDTSGLIQAGTVAAGGKLDLYSLYGQMNSICREKTKVLLPDGSVQYYNLSYITNLTVPTTQGILYYGYVSEGDTGAGVGATEQYYVTPSLGQLSMQQLSFVPRTSFSGTAEIHFNGWNTNGQSFSGTIRVPVGSASTVSGIMYNASVDYPANFRADDFNTVCRGRTGRDLSYVTFTLPSSAYGTLYYGYTGQFGERVTTGTHYQRSGTNQLDKVSFVPAQGYTGTVRVTYRAVDTAGVSFTGQVVISVTAQAGQGSVNYSGAKGRPVYFQASDFNMACYSATNELLSYVRFDLPASSQGTLYYNYYATGSYNSTVSSGTNYYRNGTPGISSVCFVPASTASDTVSIGFTGFGTGGTSFAGTVYIRLDGTATGTPQGIRYTAYRGRPAVFSANDFNNACLAATGANLNYVNFQLPASNQGTLYYNYNTNSSTGAWVYTTTAYYRSGGSYQLNNVSFVSSGSYSGTSSFNYTGYAVTGQSFTGTVVVQVTDPVPTEVNFSGSGSSAIQFNAASIRNACSGVMNGSFSYIEITGLPSSAIGTLYANYRGSGTGSAVNVGSRYYYSGTPSISQLYFVPRSNAQGTATATYTGVSSTGERVSGRINFTITRSGTSRYFTDMGGYSWAVEAVDYLYQNDVTNGVASGKYGPNQKMLRRDFVLMLCRAFGFSGGSGYSFADVPTNAYYSNAVATAKRLGIVSGDGTNFMPNSAITRQDAMVMIKNALTAAGWSLGSGTSVDLSRFVDNREVSAYARDAVGTLVRLGAVNGDERSRLNPRSDITRAEIAVILHFVMTM